MAVIVTRPREVIEETFSDRPGDRLDDYVPELSTLLSSPITSYKVSEEPGWNPQNPIRKYRLQHRQGPHQSRLKFKKEALSDEVSNLRNEIQDLQVKIQDLQFERGQDFLRNQEFQHTMLQWEIRSRICQALNDKYMKQADIKVRAALLKDNEFGYLPYFISLWAIYINHESATRFLDDVGHTQWARYADKAKDLDDDGVNSNAVQSVWDALLHTDRDLMVAMWLTRPPSRTIIAHPIPTIHESINIINSDHRLSPEEKFLAQQVIPTAVDKYAMPLFTP